MPLTYRLVGLPLTCLFALGTHLAASTPARACGGTFCDQGPQSMPVEQTGENILFVIDDGYVEAHIQIQYDPETEAANFAWLIPVHSVPEFAVGSERLFESLLAGSVPWYGMQTTVEPCDGDATGDGDGDGDGSGDGDGDGDGDPTIVDHQIVGAFEIYVLEGGTAASVMQWLGDNGYVQDPIAEPILAEYLEEGFLFVAMKLATNEAVASIHPIALRIAGDEPCVPLRLTKIAAKQDMEVRSFFLGDSRTVPLNYRHVTVNPLKIDWINNGFNYRDVIAMAVDADHADGRAFVTEYAGTSATVPTGPLVSDSWDSSAIAELVDGPIGVVDLLTEQGLIQCFEDFGCNYGHDLLAPLMAQYVPVPAEVDEGSFYACLECYEGLIDLEAWDAAAFALAFDERIVAPGVHAKELVESNPYLTRLYTMISPTEMTEDPIFGENADLADVEQFRIADREILCEGGAIVTLPDGREVYLTDPNQWPDFPEEMPWEMTVEQGTIAGANQVEVDQCIPVGAVLEDWNEAHAFAGDAYGEGCDDPDGDADGDDTDTDSDGGNAEGDDLQSRGCGCSLEEPSRAPTEFLSLLLLAPLLRRRRRA